MLLFGYIDKNSKIPLGDIIAVRDDFEMPERAWLSGDLIARLRKSTAHEEGLSIRARIDYSEKFQIELGFPCGTSLISAAGRLRGQPFFFMQAAEGACRLKMTWVSTNNLGVPQLN